jgi:3-oxoacyl-[acyl-carrier-protein] synthase-3
MYHSTITGLGYFVPENIVTNHDLSKIIDTNDEWIQERTGIQERRHVVNGSGETTSSMGVKAAQIAIERSSVAKEDIDFIVFATISPDYYFPGPGVTLQKELGLRTVGALDIRNQCSGFVYALSIADQFIKTGMYKNILIVGAELQSYGLDMTTRGRSISVIFGDGAGAAVLSRATDETSKVLSTHLHSEGEHAKELSVLAPGMGGRWVTDILADNNADDESYFPYMNGQFVFKNAVVRFSEVINEGLQANSLQVSDINMLIPHQANLRISQFIQKKFGLNDDQVYNNIQKFGNTTAASIPIALTQAWEEGRIKKGDTVVLAAFGSGFTWASAIIKW